MRVIALAAILLGMQTFSKSCGADVAAIQEQDGLGSTFLQEIADEWEKVLYGSFTPIVSYAKEGRHEAYWLLQGQIDSLLPFYEYCLERTDISRQEPAAFREILLAEAQEGISDREEGALDENPYGQEEGLGGQSIDELMRAENEAAQQMQEAAESRPFLPHGRMVQVDLESLGDYETLIQEFYTIDSNTMAGSDQLDVDKLLAKDMTLTDTGEGPQILIYHTHSQEAFADSVPGDSDTSIVGVGERLARILEQDYGYRVLHHTAVYDTVRDEAYSQALPDLEQLLSENPSIQVIIDLHRDSVADGTKLAVDLDGRPTARFMFFNGLSRTKKTGKIAYLYNENQDDNLAFSFQMQLKAAEYYPGLTRRIYLKGYRYNMHLRPRCLLVELGAQNNTVEEAMNACDPLAHILDMVLSGQ